jgi:hypothetical protein
MAGFEICIGISAKETRLPELGASGASKLAGLLAAVYPDALVEIAHDGLRESVEAKEALADLVVIVVGNNHQWAKAATLDEAVRNAGNPKKWVAYVAKPDTQVSEVDAGFSWTRGWKPKLITSKGITKAELEKVKAVWEA